MCFGICDREGVLEYIHAGHPSPLLLRGNAVSELYTGGSFPVGLVDDAEFTAAQEQLQPGDTLVLFTDGVTEAMNPEDELFGYARLREVLAGGGSESLEALQERILNAVRKFVNGAKASDDITLLMVRYRRPATKERDLEDGSAPGCASKCS
jgi:sigma-B regulation protein RsbU (phosphoserine phosphatase)